MTEEPDRPASPSIDWNRGPSVPGQVAKSCFRPGTRVAANGRSVASTQADRSQGELRSSQAYLCNASGAYALRR
jgi:hypothetical protein